VGGAAERYILNQLLQSALRFEADSAAFYREAESRVNGRRARELLRRLADEEAAHELRIRALLAEDHPEEVLIPSGAAALPDPPDANAEPPPVHTGGGVAEVLGVARAREEASRDFYRQLADNDRSAESVCAAFAFLAEEEERHIAWIDTLAAERPEANGKDATG